MKLIPILIIAFILCSCNSLVKINDSEDISFIQNEIEKDFFNILTLVDKDPGENHQIFLSNKKVLIRNINSIGKINQQSNNGRLMVELIQQLNEVYAEYSEKNNKSIDDLSKAINELKTRNNFQLNRLN